MSWIWNGTTADLQEEGTFAQQLAGRVIERIAAKKYDSQDISYLKDLPLCIKNPNVRSQDTSFQVQEEELILLRRLCSTWDIQVKELGITSHRRFLGPIIVAFKRAAYPLLKTLLKDFLRQQRDFNATSILLLIQLSQRKNS